jgi:hypothetical protein
MNPPSSTTAILLFIAITAVIGFFVCQWLTRRND